MQGQGKYQLERRLKTESKIVAFLKLQQFGFNELQLISGIRRNSLRNTLDSLVDRKIVIKHIIKNPTDKKVRRGTYYSINSNNPEARRLLDTYYKESPPPITKPLKKELLASMDKFRRKLENENDIVLEQVAIFKKDIEPFIDKPDSTMKIWFDCLDLFRHHRQLMDKTLKIFMIKLRVKLDYV